jgi:hypothetical protein
MSVLSRENGFGGAMFRTPEVFRHDEPLSMAQMTTLAPGWCVSEQCLM